MYTYFVYRIHKHRRTQQTNVQIYNGKQRIKKVFPDLYFMYGLGFKQINLQKKIMRRHINGPAHKCLISEFSWGSLKQKYWRKKN